MRLSATILFVVVCLCAAGCGRKTADFAVSLNPLSVNEWKAMPVEQKYEIESFERLKLGNPRLQRQQEWDQFSRTVIVPSRQRDLPGKKSHPSLSE